MASPEQTRNARRRPTLGLRSLALLAVALGLAFAGAGCGSDDDEASGTTTEPAATTGPGSPATVPDAAAADLADVAQQFADAGLRVAVEYAPASEPQGRVIGQSRPPGTELQRGDAVSLQVSAGPNPPEKVTVPDATEKTEAEGRAVLEAARFEVLSIKLPAVEDDIVVSHAPPAAARIPRGSLVILYAGG